MTKFFLFFVASLLFFACGGNKAVTKPENASNPKAISGLENLDENFDPLSLNEPPIPIIAKNKDRKANANTEAADTQQTVEIPEEIIGYRIQIYQTENAQEARDFQQDAFLRLDIDAYVSYDNPYYKVRIGDFTSRYDAEEFLTTLEGRGYKTAWIVRTLVVNPAAKAATVQDEQE
ncbi:MAG: SPOR domain-containing protein [Deferribacteres bacterium]|nr:SPOR domain-containing protein [candidate division KSB1 bacterium]MCB9510604.1 SPOR domain-containing protein [Deferribacteres bacterium]